MPSANTSAGAPVVDALAASGDMRLRPAVFREDLITLFDLLHAHKIKPLISQRLSLVEARHAHELLGEGGVTGKIVLMGRTTPCRLGSAGA